MKEVKVNFPYLEHVHGWLHTEALLFTSYCVSNIIDADNFDSLEIGVYQGKFLIGIENLTPRDSRCIAIDCFSKQEANIDGAGHGDLEIFTSNYKKFSLNSQRVIPIEMDSLEINCNALGRKQFGIISIDACHTERHTINDLLIAEELIMDDGVVVLDDITNQDWMGVVSGAYKFFTSGSKGNLVPFAVGFNKLFCCTAGKRDSIMSLLAIDSSNLNSANIHVRKITEFAGYGICVLEKNV
jgi:hypothetical protein